MSPHGLQKAEVYGQQDDPGVCATRSRTPLPNLATMSYFFNTCFSSSSVILRGVYVQRACGA